MDEAHEWTEQEIERLTRDLEREYNQAAKEMRDKLSKMLADFDEENGKWKERLASGSATQKEYEAWLETRAMDKEFVSNMADTLAQDAVNADKRAMELVNNAIPTVYAENANRAAFEIDSRLGQYHSFDLYDQSTVRRLIANPDSDLLPIQQPPIPNPKVDARKDKPWNKRKFNSAITQSILQGESIPNTAKRLQTVLKMDENAAVRAARTAMTGAENAGRVDSYRRAKSIGIDLEQEWMATLDMRTRHSHRELDGQHVPVGEKFKVDGIELEFPADPTAPPEYVYNCFLGETTVATDSQIEKSYCHEYVGKLVTIDTATGIHFTCTPNHPILTTNGWVAAELLHDGDDLLVTGVRDIELPWRNPNVNHVLPSMKALHELLRVFSSKRATGLSVDFHGDVATSNVEVVAKEGLLRLHRNVRLGKSLLELVLKRADSSGLGKRSPMKGLSRIVASASSIMRSLCVCAPFLWGHGLHADIHGLGTSTRLDSSVTKYTVDNLPAETMVRSELLSGLPRQVLVDKVVNVKVSSTRGTQVYNLQTENGYYFANGVSNDKFIIAKNCRCTLVAWFPDLDEDERWSKLPSGMTYDEWKNGKTLTQNVKSQKTQTVSYDERRNAAKWFETAEEADNTLRRWSGKRWNEASDDEKVAIYEYTSGEYGYYNSPLNGYNGRYRVENYVGVGNADIDCRSHGKEIRDMTAYLQGSVTQQDMWLRRGEGATSLAPFFGYPVGTDMSALPEDELRGLIGTSGRIGSFQSCGTTRFTGFTQMPVTIEYFVPAGSQAAYVEPFSECGHGDGLMWDGVSGQSSFGSELETVLQRGGSYTLVDVRYDYKRDPVFVMEVHPEDGYWLFQQ